MDKAIRRIEQSRSDPTLLRQAFSDIEEILAAKLIENTKDTSKFELSWLFNQCGSPDQILANEACQTVLRLTLKGILSVNESITALTTSATTAKHCGILVNVVIELVLQGSYAGKKQPLIALIDIAPDIWPFLLHHTNHLLSCSNLNRLIWEDIKVFYLYCLRSSPLHIRTILWSQLYGEIFKMTKTEVLELLLESLIWLNQDSEDLEAAFLQVNCVKQLCDYALVKQDKDLAEATAVMLTSIMVEQNGYINFGIQPFFDLLEKLSKVFDFNMELILMMLSQLMLECIPSYYKVMLNFFLQQKSRSCNKYAWSMIKFSALSIFSYDREVESNVISLCESTSETNNSHEKRHYLCLNKYYHHLQRFSIAIQESLEILNLMEDNISVSRYAEDTSNRKISAPSTLMFIFDCAVFWESCKVSCLHRAVNFVTSQKKFAQPLLTLLLKKLTTSCNGKTKLAILYRLPSLTVDKSCVPRVLQILGAMAVCSQLVPLQISLLADLWKVEDRAYPYLEKLLISDRLQSDETLLAKASAVSAICSLRPEKYGSGVLSVVSELLNISLCSANPNHTTVACLALGSLISLCRAEVVDLKSVWDLLSPKLLQENRAHVTAEMCRLLSLVPCLKVDSEQYAEFTHQAISILFRISITTAETTVANAALNALSEFSKTEFHVRDLPEVCREELRIPAKYAAPHKGEVPVKAEDVLDYIPGYCWMKLLDCYSGNVLQNGVFSLLSRLIKEEVESLPKWVYKKASAETVRRNEPLNYNSTLKEDSILAAAVQYVQRICDLTSENRFRMELVLKILAGPFSKPLPPIDWSALLGFAHQHDLQFQMLHVVFKQAVDSFSAQSITEAVLTREPLKRNEALAAISHLETISKAVSSKCLQNFVCRIFSDFPADFDAILRGLQHSFDATDSIPVELKGLIAEAVLSIYPQISDDKNCITPFAICHGIFCGSHQSLIEPTSRPSVSLKVYLLAAMNSKGKAAAEYLYKAIQLTANIECLNRATTDEIITAVSSCDITTDFILQFMSYIQLNVMRPATKNQHATALLHMLSLLLGILSSSFIPLGCLDDLQSEESVPGMLAHFPLYTARLFNQPKWKAAKRSMQDWIMAMSESSSVSSTERRKILDALPLLGGVDKEIFLKAIGTCNK